MENDNSSGPGGNPGESIQTNEKMNFWYTDRTVPTENPSGILYFLDAQHGNILFISDAVHGLAGYAPDDFYEGDVCWSDLVHPDDMQAFLQAQQNLMERSSRSVCSEYRIARSDGTIRYVRDITQRVVQNGQNFLTGAVTDISDMKRREARLKHLERRYSVMKEAEGMGLWELRVDDQMVVVDHEVCRICSLPQEKQVMDAESLMRILGERQREKLKDAYWRAFKENSPFDVRLSIESQTGRHRHVRAYGRIVPEHSGKGDLLVGVMLDITEYVETDRQMEADEQRLESLLNMTQQQFEREEQLFEYALQEMIDLIGCEIGYVCLLDETQAWIKKEIMCKRHSCDIQSQHRLPVSERGVASLLISAEDPIVMNQSKDHMLVAGLQEHYAVSITNLAGIRIPSDDQQHAQAVLLLGNKDEDFTFGDIRQIRLMSGFVWQMILNRRKEQETKSYEMQLKQSKRMETIGRLVSGVSHDFKNMLTVILGYADMLEEECAKQRGDTSSPVHQAFHDLRIAAERALGISNQLLVFSQEHTLVPQVIYLKQEAMNIQRMLQRLVQEDVEVSFAVDKNLWVFKMDINQLNQVFLNLFINARDAMPQGGVIRVSAQNCYRVESPHLMQLSSDHEQFVAVSVEDTGEGIEDEHIPFLFEPFFSTKNHQGGTGIGLATVYEIIDHVGGTVEVASTRHKGTSFTFYIPAQEPEGDDMLQEPGRMEGEIRDFSGHVLLVEDDPLVLQHIQQLLRSAGFTVTAFDNPVAALEAFACSQGGYDLLVTDVIMPHINGRRLYDSLSAIHPGLPALFITGFDNDVIRKKGLEQCPVEILHKPFSKHQLLSALDRVIPADKEG